MNFRATHLFLFLLFLGTLFLPRSTTAQELSVSFEEQLVIGNQEDASKEYLFGSPEFIRTDSDGRIYVATQRNSIRVFSPEGKHLKTLGRRGRGPGEFLAIGAMAAGINDELMVYDYRARRLTTFYNLGDSVSTESFKNPRWIGDHIVPIADGTYATTIPPASSSAIAFMKDRISDFEPLNSGNDVVYLLDEDFSDQSGSFFDAFQYMFDEGEPLEVKFARASDYRLAELNDSTLALTHEISDGNIYLINLNSGDIQEVQGRFSGQESYLQLPYENRRDYIGTHFGLVTGGGYAYQNKLESDALISNGKWVLNFVRTSEMYEYTYGIEFLDNAGNYLGYTSLENDFTIVQVQYSDFIGAEVKQFKFYPMHLDDRDQLYYVDYSSDIPVIRVTRIVMEG